MWTNAVHKSGQELWPNVGHKSKQELWPNVGHNFARVHPPSWYFSCQGRRAHFPRVRPPYRVVSLTLRHIPPMPYFLHRVTISFTGARCLAPLAQTELFGLSTMPI